VQKSSKLSENDIIYIYLRSFLNYGAKQPSHKKVMRVQIFAFLAVKTEKTAKNRPRGHFQKEVPRFRILKVPQFPLLHLQTARRFQHMGIMGGVHSIRTGALFYIGSLRRFFVIVLLHFKLCITMGPKGLCWKGTCSGGLMTLRENLGS
jgi:hypothetical protein